MYTKVKKYSCAMKVVSDDESSSEEAIEGVLSKKLGPKQWEKRHVSLVVFFLF